MVYNPKELYLNNLRSDIQSQIDNIETGGVSGNFVTLDTDQVINSQKTFTSILNISGGQNPVAQNNAAIIGNGNIVLSSTVTISSNVKLGSNGQGNKFIQFMTFVDPGGENGDITFVLNETATCSPLDWYMIYESTYDFAWTTPVAIEWTNDNSADLGSGSWFSYSTFVGRKYVLVENGCYMPSTSGDPGICDLPEPGGPT